MNPRFSVIEQTTPYLTFAEDVAGYQYVGADGIGIFENKLTGDDDASLALLRESGLAVSSFHPLISSILPSGPASDPFDPQARIDAICQSIRRIAPFAPDSVFMGTGPLGSYPRDQAWEIVVDGIHRIAGVAQECGTRLALELLHPSLSDIFGFVTSIPAGIELADAVSHPNFGITIDMWHLGSPPGLLDQVRKIIPHLVAVHVNDRRDPTRSWCDRVLPGDGVADVRGILGALDDGGFDGWYELEIISDDGSVENDFPDSLWKRPPLELVSDGRAKFLAEWEARRG
jgi:sugar phosphate isomerase/epimerase